MADNLRWCSLSSLGVPSTFARRATVDNLRGACQPVALAATEQVRRRVASRRDRGQPPLVFTEFVGRAVHLRARRYGGQPSRGLPAVALAATEQVRRRVASRRYRGQPPLVFTEFVGRAVHLRARRYGGQPSRGLPARSSRCDRAGPPSRRFATRSRTTSAGVH